MANAGTYSNSDAVTIVVTSGHRTVSYSTTINTAVGSEDKNLTLTYTDILGLVIDKLNDEWVSGSTDSITPIIAEVFNYKELDMGNQDYILCYEVNETFKPFAIGGATWEHNPVISVDIRSSYKNATMSDIRTHVVKIKNEALRIIKSIVGGYGGYQRFLPLRRRDLSDKSIGISRMVIDLQATKWGT